MNVKSHAPAAIPERWRPVVRVAWMAAALIALLILAAAIPGYLAEFPGQYGGEIDLAPEWVRFFGILAAAFSLLCVAVSITLAGLLYFRRPGEVSAVTVSFYLLAYGIVLGGPLEANLVHWGFGFRLAILAQTILTTVPTIYLFVTFPDGRFVPAWSRWPVLVSAGPVLLIVLFPGEDWTTYSTPLAYFSMVLLLSALISTVVAQVVRYRRYSTAAERRQTRWVVTGLVAWFVYIGVSTVPWLITQRIPAGEPLPWWQPLAGAGWWLSLNILPVSLTVAILRYRLFDIDVLIRRTLVYSVLTAILGMVYFGLVVVLQSIFVYFSAQDSPVVVVISTLVIASMFGPLHRRVQDFIDRRFFRFKYDAEKTLDRFADAARDEVDLGRLSESLVQVVEETMQPDKCSLWLKQ